MTFHVVQGGNEALELALLYLVKMHFFLYIAKRPDNYSYLGLAYIVTKTEDKMPRHNQE